MSKDAGISVCSGDWKSHNPSLDLLWADQQIHNSVKHKPLPTLQRSTPLVPERVIRVAVDTLPIFCPEAEYRNPA